MTLTTKAFALLLGAIVCASACTSPAPQQTSTAPADPAPINSVRERYAAATKAGDVAAITALYADDAVLMPDHHAAVEGRAAIQKYYEGVFAQAATSVSITPADTEISGDIAHEHGSFSFTITPKAGGGATTENGKYLVILKRQGDGSWLIHHEIGNTNEPPPGVPGQAPQP